MSISSWYCTSYGNGVFNFQAYTQGPEIGTIIILSITISDDYTHLLLYRRPWTAMKNNNTR